MNTRSFSIHIYDLSLQAKNNWHDMAFEIFWNKGVNDDSKISAKSHLSEDTVMVDFELMEQKGLLRGQLLPDGVNINLAYNENHANLKYSLE